MRISSNDKSLRAKKVSDSNESDTNTPKKLRMTKAEDTAGTSSEEDVFARLVSDEIARTQSSETKTKFQALIDKQIAIRTRADGSVNWEKVAKGALKWASNDKQALVTRDDAEKIYSRTFAAAQLDSNEDSLDDSSVEGATMNTDLAFEKARVKLEKYVAGQSETPARSLSELVTSSTKNSASNTKSKILDTLSDIILSSDDFQI